MNDAKSIPTHGFTGATSVPTRNLAHLGELALASGHQNSPRGSFRSKASAKELLSPRGVSLNSTSPRSKAPRRSAPLLNHPDVKKTPRELMNEKVFADKVKMKYEGLVSPRVGTADTWAKDMCTVHNNGVRKELVDLLMSVYSLKSMPTHVAKPYFDRLMEWIGDLREIILVCLCIDDEILFPWIEHFEIIENLDMEKRAMTRKVVKGMLKEIDTCKLQIGTKPLKAILAALIDVVENMVRLLVNYFEEVEGSLPIAITTYHSRKERKYVREAMRELVAAIDLEEKFFACIGGAIEDQSLRDEWIRDCLGSRRRGKWAGWHAKFELTHASLPKAIVQNVVSADDMAPLFKENDL
mmetsp:Transcript_5671/g.16862  ORF Transcript_5671/g.16862 Transcript_5671/m.16862 type:complete len:354 (+) Transcript_5671:143-1204(+)